MDARALKALEYDKVKQLLLARTQTELGAELVRKLRPSADLPAVVNRLRETTEARELLEVLGPPPFAGVRELWEVIEYAAKGGVLDPLKLVQVGQFARACVQLTLYFESEEPPAPLVRALAARLVPVGELARLLESALSPEGEVLDEASETLHSLRRQLARTQQAARERARRLALSPDLAPRLQEPVVALRNDRFCLPVKAEYASTFGGILHDRSASGATLFIEPQELVEVNNKLRELAAAEREEVERILAQLSAEVGSRAAELETNHRALAVLDAVFARAELSRWYDGAAPEMALDGPLYLNRARHPLLPADKVVPIDFELAEDVQGVLLTGPNTGGKTVTLKTVGLLHLMAQSGLHIPAEPTSRLRCFKRIFADIGDEQSLEQSLSTFSAHLSYQVKILKQADEDTLVLLDELGAGTDPSEGSALARAVVEKLLEARATLVASTHYNDLKIYAYNHPLLENASVEFDAESLKPTYRLLMGVPGSSHAFHIASRLGLPGKVIKRARELRGLEAANLETVLKKLERTQRRLERERVRIARLRRSLEAQQVELERKQADFERMRKEAEAEGFAELRRELARLRAQALEQLKTLKEASTRRQAEASYSKLRKLEGEAEELERRVQAQLRPEAATPPPEHLEKGDTVHVLSLDLDATVVEPPNEKDEVLIAAGALQTWVKRTDLRLSEQPSQVTGERLAESFALSKFLSVPTELNVIGKRVEEALELVEEWLQESHLAGHKHLRLVHGKGTGALRNALHAYLKDVEFVVDFHSAERSEGGTGATIIELSE